MHKVIANANGMIIKDAEGKMIHEIRYQELDNGIFHLHTWCMSRNIESIVLVCQIDVLDSIEAILYVRSKENIYGFKRKVKALILLNGMEG